MPDRKPHAKPETNASGARPTTHPVGQSVPDSPALKLAPVLVMGQDKGAWLEPGGTPEPLDRKTALALAQATPPVLCHAPAVARRLGADSFPAFDLLELFAFVRPAAFCVPTPLGLAQALGLAAPEGLGQSAQVLAAAAQRLLEECAARLAEQDPSCTAIAWTMARAGWRWGPAVLEALGAPHGPAGQAQGTTRGTGLEVWSLLPEWEEPPPAPPPGTEPVDPTLARTRLSDLLGEAAEPRPQQSDYASALAQAFRPRDSAEDPIVVLAEAGTGVGKTLGYIAPASLWSETNKEAVWISTYTRNLQHQIDQELDRLYPEPQEKSKQVVIRKGRENYLCLLNFEEAAKGVAVRPGDAVAAGLMARWAAHSRDGDMTGGDFPGWLPELIGRGPSLGLTDRRGECIYSACLHYRKCFIERSIRRARRAATVVANHALVMIQAARGAAEEGTLPSHLVFDEGHHLFAAADSAFSAHLSGQETLELRRWLVGAEARGRSAGRLRGLRRRLEDVVAGDGEAEEALEAGLSAARCLVSDGWQQRLRDGAPHGPAEAFLKLAREQVYARARNPDGPYSLETEPRPPVDGLLDAATELETALTRLAEPLKRLNRRLAARLDEDADSLTGETRRRIDGACRGLRHRALDQIAAWRDMLTALAGETPPEFVDWLEVTRSDGRDLDVGLHRHWTDPTRPFAEAVLTQAQATAITSATLTDGTGDAEGDWAAAEMRTGAAHLPAPAVRVRVPSPFDYGAQTRVLIVGDVRKDDMGQVAAAYRELFRAAGGGGLGLFTAIARLRAVQRRIAAPLEESGIPLLAQHVDRMDTSTLVDIFRAEADTCLLGTDAVRDGVDVPGRALRLIVFDRVPWARPDIRHRARREIFGGRAYDDMIARLKLKQAYGRLIRRADDHGVFVLLDPMMPSRLLSAFPEGVTARRCGLAEAVDETRAFLSLDPGPGA
jgi:ATP-dependent DNA helicase DinG